MTALEPIRQGHMSLCHFLPFGRRVGPVYARYTQAITYKWYSGTCLERPPHCTGHKIVVSQDRWSLVTGSITLKCRNFCQGYLVFEDRLSLMAVVSQDRFHCTSIKKLRNSQWSHWLPTVTFSYYKTFPGQAFVSQWIYVTICIKILSSCNSASRGFLLSLSGSVNSIQNFFFFYGGRLPSNPMKRKYCYTKVEITGRASTWYFFLFYDLQNNVELAKNKVISWSFST